jgi:hypothetical protein
MNPDDPAIGPCYGLTIRQHYEIECLTGLLANPQIDILRPNQYVNDAIYCADALIQAQQARDTQENQS